MSELDQYITPVSVEPQENTVSSSDISAFATPVETTQTQTAATDLSQFVTPVSSDMEPTPEESSISASLLRGVKRAVAPMALTTTEYKDTDAASITGQIIGDVAASATASKLGAAVGGVLGGALTAGPGAAPGAFIGAVAGVGAWAMYKGIAGEAADANADERNFSPINAAVGVGAELNPFSKGTKAARAARQAALSAGHTYLNTEDLSSAAVAGIVGGAVIGLTPAQKQWFDNINLPRAFPNKENPEGKLSPQSIEEQVKFIKDESAQVLKRADEYMQENKVSTELPYSIIQTIQSKQLINEEDAPFIQWMLGKPSAKLKSAKSLPTVIKEGTDDLEHFAEKHATWSKEQLQNSYETFVTGRVQRQETRKYAEQMAKEYNPIQDPLENSPIFASQAPAQFVSRKIDNVLGTNLEGGVIAFSEAANNFSTAAAPFIKQNNELAKQIKTSKISPEDIGRMLAGKMEATEEAAPIISEYRKLYKNLRQHQIESGYDIGELENYFPQMMKDPAETIATLKLTLRDLASKYGNQDINTIPEATDFVRVLKHIKSPGDPEVTISNREVAGLIEHLVKPDKMKSFLGYEGSATFTRQGVTPEFITNFDVIGVTQNYINQNLKPIYYKTAFEQMKNNIGILRGAGLDKSVDYFQNYLLSLSGQPSNYHATIAATINKLKSNAIIQGADATGTFDKLSAKTKQFLPDFLSWNIAKIYENYLGWNIAGPLRNMTQTLLMTAPEIGGTYGYNLVTRGWREAGRALKSLPKDAQDAGLPLEKGVNKALRIDRMQAFLQDKGFAGGEFIGEGAKMVSNSMRQSTGLAGKAIEVIDDIGKVGMTLYSGSDVANKFITYHTAKELAKDIRLGKTAAKQFLENLPAGMKYEVSKAKTEGELGDKLASYLIAKTQFHYGPEAISAFGREYGKAVTMFTRWPTTVWSDIHELQRAGKYGTMGAKYIAPLAALIGIDHGLSEAGVMDSPMGKILFGKGVVSASPVNSLTGIDVPPILQVPIKTAEAARHAISSFSKEDLDEMETELAKSLKILKQTYSPFMPGGFIPVAYNRLETAFSEE